MVVRVSLWSTGLPTYVVGPRWNRSHRHMCESSQHEAFAGACAHDPLKGSTAAHQPKRAATEPCLDVCIENAARTDFSGSHVGLSTPFGQKGTLSACFTTSRGNLAQQRAECSDFAVSYGSAQQEASLCRFVVYAAAPAHMLNGVPMGEIDG